MRFGSPRRISPAINLTPLIDILFIVLIFLVLTATFREATALRLTLPRTTTGERIFRDAPDVVGILIDSAGAVSYGDQVVSLDELSVRLEAISQDDATVLLTADSRVNHGRVIEVMDRVRRAGIYRLSIETIRANDVLLPQ